MQEIHLGIAFDQNYLTPFYALVTSIFTHNKGRRIHIHAIVSGVSEEEKKNIKQYVVTRHGLIDYYTIDSNTVSQFVVTGTWTSAVYYRLYFPFLIPETIKRLLYLDTDTLVVNDLAELYNIDLTGYPVGAVYDNWVKKAPHISIHEENNYFNSGVLLIDIRKWKEQIISEQSFAYLDKYPERIRFVDQDALNAVLLNNWKKLDGKYNLMYTLIPDGISKKKMKEFIADKVVLHFTLQRPWQLLCRNRFRALYFHYSNQSPAKKQQKIIDFNWRKVPCLLRIRLTELYYDVPGLQKVWKRIKAVSIQSSSF